MLGLLLLSTAACRQAALEPAGFASDRTGPRSGDRAVASVDGEPISELEWQQAVALDRMMSAFAGQPEPSAEAVLQRLVNQRLVLRQAQQLQLSATIPQAETRLAELIARWGIGQAELSTALTQAGLTRAQVLEAIRRLLMVEAYLARFGSHESASRWLTQQRQQARVSIYVDLAAQAQPPRLRAAALPATPLVLMPAQPTIAPSSPTPSVSAPSTPTPSPDHAAPDFTLPDLDGQPVSLSQFRGQVVVLNFWASWCPVCRAETRDVADFAREYRSRSVVVLGVNLREDAQTVRAFAQANDMAFPILLDSTGEVAARYQVVGIPTTIIVDAAGNIQRRRVGALTQAQLAEYVADWLPARPPAPAFTLPRENGQPVSLADYHGRSVVLLFYRSAGCGACLQQLRAFHAVYNRFKAMNAEVLAIAVQSVAQAQATQELNGFAFPVLADPRGQASTAFGVYNRLGDGLAAPAVFVVAPEGHITWSYIGQSANDYPSPEHVLKRAF